MSCPFYGFSAIRIQHGDVAGELVVVPNPGSNQCPIYSAGGPEPSHTPCQMEFRGEHVDWNNCPLKTDAKMQPLINEIKEGLPQAD